MKTTAKKISDMTVDEFKTIIHEVIVAMKNKNNVKTITDTIHIHPALPEVVERAFLNIDD